MRVSRFIFAVIILASLIHTAPSVSAQSTAQADWKSKVIKYEGDAKQIEQDARNLQEQAVKLEEEIQKRQPASLHPS